MCCVETNRVRKENGTTTKTHGSISEEYGEEHERDEETEKCELRLGIASHHHHHHHHGHDNLNNCIVAGNR